MSEADHPGYDNPALFYAWWSRHWFAWVVKLFCCWAGTIFALALSLAQADILWIVGMFFLGIAAGEIAALWAIRWNK